MHTLNCNGRLLTIERPLVMGILNVTPDSFYAGSRVSSAQQAVDRAGTMLAEGAGLQNSGAISLLVDGVAPMLATLPPGVVIFCVFLITTVLTEVVSNNAVAVIMTPIAISLAAALGTDPRQF